MKHPSAPLDMRDLLLRLLDQAYDRSAWHGPNLRGSIRGLDAAQACWRPAPQRHSIAEHVLHAAYWKYAVRRRLLNQRRGSFPLEGSNWFAVPDDLTSRQWKDCIRLLEEQHRLLREAAAQLPPGKWARTPARGNRTASQTLLMGIAAHDVYHAGQIQLLKRLARQALASAR